MALNSVCAEADDDLELVAGFDTFGDGDLAKRVSEVVLEKTMSASDVTTVPDCIGGRRACPPEDCGGPWGYRELLDILADSNHPEHEERLEWAGGEIDPSPFDSAEFAENLRHQQTIGHQALADLIDFDAEQ